MAVFGSIHLSTTCWSPAADNVVLSKAKHNYFTVRVSIKQHTIALPCTLAMISTCRSCYTVWRKSNSNAHGGTEKQINYAHLVVILTTWVASIIIIIIVINNGETKILLISLWKRSTSYSWYDTRTCYWLGTHVQTIYIIVRYLSAI